MVGLESLEDDDSEVADATVTFAELLNSDLPSEEAEARHLGSDLIEKDQFELYRLKIHLSFGLRIPTPTKSRKMGSFMTDEAVFKQKL